MIEQGPTGGLPTQGQIDGINDTLEDRSALIQSQHSVELSTSGALESSGNKSPGLFPELALKQGPQRAFRCVTRVVPGVTQPQELSHHLSDTVLCVDGTSQSWTITLSAQLNDLNKPTLQVSPSQP